MPSTFRSRTTRFSSSGFSLFSEWNASTGSSTLCARRWKKGRRRQFKHQRRMSKVGQKRIMKCWICYFELQCSIFSKSIHTPSKFRESCQFGKRCHSRAPTFNIESSWSRRHQFLRCQQSAHTVLWDSLGREDTSFWFATTGTNQLLCPGYKFSRKKAMHFLVFELAKSLLSWACEWWNWRALVWWAQKRKDSWTHKKHVDTDVGASGCDLVQQLLEARFAWKEQNMRSGINQDAYTSLFHCYSSSARSEWTTCGLVKIS